MTLEEMWDCLNVEYGVSEQTLQVVEDSSPPLTADRGRLRPLPRDLAGLAEHSAMCDGYPLPTA